MFEQQPSGVPSPSPPPLSWPLDTIILDWIAGWQPAREEVQSLLNAYAQADGGHDISGFEPLLDQVDTAMRLLCYRVDWLRGYLGHVTQPPQYVD